jgi:predicted nucleic acid-binding protein
VASRHGLDAEEITQIMLGMAQLSVVVQADDVVAVVADDPEDEIIACAMAGEADYIVSGDTRLLSLGEYRGIQILSPRLFLTILRGDEAGLSDPP